MVVPQAMPAMDTGFVEIERPTTWNGPGRRQMPVTPMEEVMDLPGLPTVIEPPTADVELS